MTDHYPSHDSYRSQDNLVPAPTQLDPFSRLLGIELVNVSQGAATLKMTIREDMTNPHGTPHGGAIFTLADSALAVASNSHGIEAVALDVSITYARPAALGAVVFAKASELNLTKRTGLYDIRITTEDGKLVASARGTVFRTGRSFAGWGDSE